MTPRGMKLPRRTGPAAIGLITLAAIGAIFWGTLVDPPEVQVFTFDAGPASEFEIGKVKALEQLDIYLVGLADGRIRALDGIVEENGCAVEFRPDDQRGSAHNPSGVAGAFVDPCSGAVWAITGDALTAPWPLEPLRTPRVTFPEFEDGTRHVLIEVIGRPRPAAAE